MTTTGQTGDKPVTAVRRRKVAVKTASGGGAEPASSSTSEKPADGVPAVPTPPVSTEPEAQDRYRSAGRVWPD